MPLYMYGCQKCGEKFEFWSRLFELNREIKCPKCGAENPKQLNTTDSQESKDSEGCEVYTTRESS